MNNLLKLILKIFVALAVLVAVLFVSGNGHIIYGLRGTYLIGETRPDIDDKELFDLRKIDTGKPEPWPEALSQTELGADHLAYMDSLETTAFLVFHRDTLRYERYALGYTPESYSNSFSMAKSFTSLAIGAAVDEGLLSVNLPVATYLPRFEEGLSADLTVEQLLQMRSNIDFGESYSSPFGYQAKAYYGKDLRTITEPFRVSSDPGTLWKYEGGNTVLLAEILEKKTGKNVSEWFESAYWNKIGAEQPAYWNLDSKGGVEKAFSGFYASARDFARVGKLMLHGGSWAGKQLVNEAWVAESISPHFTPDEFGKPVTHYGYQWWMAPPDEEPWHFQARGMRGQYIIVVPEESLVIVRLGHRRDEGEKVRGMSKDLLRWVEMGRIFAD